MNKGSYRKFGIMMIVSFLLMYVIMFLNLDKLAHYHTSLTRIYMALLMVAPMAILMILMMKKMYPDKRTNSGIIITAAIVFITILTSLRTQSPIKDVQYLKAMISHHSSAIMTSKQANIEDPEVRKLADRIIASQEWEIQQMEKILDRKK